MSAFPLTCKLWISQASKFFLVCTISTSNERFANLAVTNERHEVSYIRPDEIAGNKYVCDFTSIDRLWKGISLLCRYFKYFVNLCIETIISIGSVFLTDIYYNTGTTNYLISKYLNYVDTTYLFLNLPKYTIHYSFSWIHIFALRYVI